LFLSSCKLVYITIRADYMCKNKISKKNEKRKNGNRKERGKRVFFIYFFIFVWWGRNEMNCSAT
jgi:hypothetical protein